MKQKTFIRRTLSWIRTNQKPALIILALLIIVILTENLAIKYIDSFAWYKEQAVDFIQLLKWMCLLALGLAIFSQIPYIRVPAITLGMSALLLIGVEAVCLILYEYKNRPNAEKETADENSGPGLLEKFRGIFAEEKTDPEPKEEGPVPAMPVTPIPPEALGVDALPENFDQLKIAGEPEFTKEDPKWDDWQKQEPDMGYVNKPGAHVEMKSWNYGIPNPVAHYSIDSLGRRMTGNDIRTPRKKYAMFLGCSVTFGVLVDDKQTMPSILERIDTTYRSYNYGVSGYGTHHLLALFQNGNLKSEIPEADGVAFYVYFLGHTNRAIGDMESYLSWNADCPFYYMDGDSVVRRGNFREGRKLISGFYEILAKSYIGKYFDIRLPGKTREHHYQFTANLIEQSYKEYQKQFGNDNFYVLLLPGWGNNIVPYLKEKNIKYLDYDRLLPYWQDKYRFAGDGHPRPLLYKTLAEQIDMDVLKK